MSYCGACGGFYYEGCPRRPENICAPAPNPHDQSDDVTARILTNQMAIMTGLALLLRQTPGTASNAQRETGSECLTRAVENTARMIR